MMNQNQVNQLCEDNELAFFRAEAATRVLERRQVAEASTFPVKPNSYTNAI